MRKFHVENYKRKIYHTSEINWEKKERKNHKLHGIETDNQPNINFTRVD